MPPSRTLSLVLRALGIVCAVLAVLTVGILLGGHPSWLPGPVRNALVSESESQRISEDVMGMISRDYFRKVNTTTLTNNGLEAAVKSLNDPYSHYYPASLYNSFENELSPQVTGIGAELAPEPVDGGIQIEEVFQDSPAARAGLSHGDVITAVNGVPLKGKSVDGASRLIRGREGSSVELTVKSGHRTREVTLVRREVLVPVVASKLVHFRGRKIGYIDFSQFAEGSAAELRAQVKKLMQHGAQGLIIDLRDNPGGLLEQAVAAASIFLQHGTIVTTRGRAVPTTTYIAQGDAIATKIPLVLVVDRGTASSAEILTAALKQNHRALVVGTHTYGKGVFQEIMPVTGGGALDITVGEYFTPDGRNLGGGGVKRGSGIAPNIYVYDNPNDPGSKAITVAEKTVSGQIR